MAERSIELDSIELAAAIFGNCDQNIHLLEKEFHVTAVCRGSVLRFTGAEADVDAAAHAVDGMVTLMENHTPLEEQTVRYCISLTISLLSPPRAALSTPRPWGRRNTWPPSAATPLPSA